MHPNPLLTVAGVIVTLAFFALIAYVITVLRGKQKLAAIVAATAALAGVLPEILRALGGMR